MKRRLSIAGSKPVVSPWPSLAARLCGCVSMSAPRQNACVRVPDHQACRFHIPRLVCIVFDLRLPAHYAYALLCSSIILFPCVLHPAAGVSRHHAPLPMWLVSNQSVDELANAGIKMAEVNKLKEAHIATVGAVLATPTKVRRCLKGYLPVISCRTDG